MDSQTQGCYVESDFYYLYASAIKCCPKEYKINTNKQL